LCLKHKAFNEKVKQDLVHVRDESVEPDLIQVTTMGGGTFFKVGGGTSARWKEIIANFVFELASVTSQTLKYDVITYTPYQGLNYTISDKTTPLW